MNRADLTQEEADSIINAAYANIADTTNPRAAFIAGAACFALSCVPAVPPLIHTMRLAALAHNLGISYEITASAHLLFELSAAQLQAIERKKEEARS